MVLIKINEIACAPGTWNNTDKIVSRRKKRNVITSGVDFGNAMVSDHVFGHEGFL